TNDLDLMTLRVLEEALCAFPGVVLVVSHDRFFLDRVATRIVYLDGHGGHRIHAGDLSGLLDKLRAERAATDAAAVPRTAEPARPSERATANRKLSTRERQELEALPDRLAAAEQQVAALDARLADPATWTDPAIDGHKVAEQREAAQREVEALYARWEELEALAGQ
ncbi:MAG: ABC transporter ATP-binding protein, partial [Planctomycetes bacterium]|nr:ABC transporter ATP-binding protein [Planctomycetota bacterium]